MNIPLLYCDRRTESSDTLRQTQLVQLHLLHVFDEVCKKIGVSYFLGGGTLLGAIRHDGFIPWDDDLDVGMSVRDYRKFIAQAHKYLPKDVLLQSEKDVPEQLMSYAKLRDAYSFQCEIGSIYNTGRHLGIFIDIFPYYDLPGFGLPVERALVRMTNKSYILSRSLRWTVRKNPVFAPFSVLLSYPLWLFNKGMHFFIWLMCKIVPAKRMFLDIDFFMVVPYERNAVYPLSKHKFEDDQFPVPHNPDTVLTAQYGDWRTPPPTNARHGGHCMMVLPFNTSGVSGSMVYPK